MFGDDGIRSVFTRIAGLSRPDRNCSVSKVIDEASRMGADARHITSEGFGGLSSIDPGLIDWKKMLPNSHWVVIPSITNEEGVAGLSAWSSSMSFAELEGVRCALFVEPSEDSSGMEMLWGSIVQRIRQVHLLFMTPRALNSISKIEGLPPELLLSEIRRNSLVPLVCSFNPETGMAQVEHSFGTTKTIVDEPTNCERWFASFIVGLAQSGSGKVGIDLAASTINSNYYSN